MYALAENNDVQAGQSKEDDKLKVKGVSMMQAVQAEVEFLDKSACRVCSTVSLNAPIIASAKFNLV